MGDYSTAANTHFVLNKDENGNVAGPVVHIPVHNALAGMIDSGALLARPRAERLQYYWNLTTAIANGDEGLAFSIGRVYGWELDIMKASYEFLWRFLFFVLEDSMRYITSLPFLFGSFVCFILIFLLISPKLGFLFSFMPSYSGCRPVYIYQTAS